MIGLFWLIIKALPWPALIRLGEYSGNLARQLAPKRRRIAEKNIRRCLPELSHEKQQQLLKDHFRAMGAAALEMGLGWWGSDRALATLGHIEGSEHLAAAKARGKGIIFFAPHFSTMEIAGRLMSFHQPFSATYRASKNPVIETLYQRCRLGHIQTVIPNRDVRGLIRLLNDGGILWYAADQAARPKQAVIAPLFNKPTLTLTAPARLAQLTGATLLPLYTYRLPKNEGYVLHFLPPPKDFPSGDPTQDATSLNRIIEQMIRHQPAQYFWSHERFKYDERYLDAEGKLRAS